jgi:hypothetical protein
VLAGLHRWLAVESVFEDGNSLPPPWGAPIAPAQISMIETNARSYIMQPSSVSSD